MQLNPDIKEAHIVKGWYTNAVNSGTLNLATHASDSLTSGQRQKKNDLKTISQIKDDNLGFGDKAFNTLIMLTLA